MWGAVVVVLAGAGYLAGDSLVDVGRELFARRMFLPADSDSFDPGLPVGERFPVIDAWHRGRRVQSTRAFVHDRGMVFIANRSAHW